MDTAAVLILVAGGVGVKLYDRMLVPLFMELAEQLGIGVKLLPWSERVAGLLVKLTPGLTLHPRTDGSPVKGWPNGTAGRFRNLQPDPSKPDSDAGRAEWIKVHRRSLADAGVVELDAEGRIDRWLLPLPLTPQLDAHLPSIKRAVHHTQWVVKTVGPGCDANRSDMLLPVGRHTAKDDLAQAEAHAKPGWWPQFVRLHREGTLSLRHSIPGCLTDDYKAREVAAEVAAAAAAEAAHGDAALESKGDGAAEERSAGSSAGGIALRAAAGLLACIVLLWSVDGATLRYITGHGSPCGDWQSPFNNFVRWHRTQMDAVSHTFVYYLPITHTAKAVAAIHGCARTVATDFGLVAVSFIATEFGMDWFLHDVFHQVRPYTPPPPPPPARRPSLPLACAAHRHLNHPSRARRLRTPPI